MLLEARHLAIAYGDAVAVWDATLEVGDGEVVAVIGPNGAGKSTLINAVAGLLRWRAGELLLDGLDLATVPPHLMCGHGIALVPEGRRLPSHKPARSARRSRRGRPRAAGYGGEQVVASSRTSKAGGKGSGWNLTQATPNSTRTRLLREIHMDGTS
jgi:branched-chain amino acid transport system ATP-binding protein